MWESKTQATFGEILIGVANLPHLKFQALSPYFLVFEEPVSKLNMFNFPSAEANLVECPPEFFAGFC